MKQRSLEVDILVQLSFEVVWHNKHGLNGFVFKLFRDIYIYMCVCLCVASLYWGKVQKRCLVGQRKYHNLSCLACCCFAYTEM